MERSKTLFVALSFAALALYPLVAGSFGIDLVTKTMIYAIFALSLELLVGGTGLVCFGHAAFFGVGAYALVLLSGSAGAASLLWLLPCCVLAAAGYGLFVGGKALDGAALVNAGTLTWHSDTVKIRNGAAVRNLVAATFDIRAGEGNS